jgi:hypothetical protein
MNHRSGILGGEWPSGAPNTSFPCFLNNVLGHLFHRTCDQSPSVILVTHHLAPHMTVSPTDSCILGTAFPFNIKYGDCSVLTITCIFSLLCVHERFYTYIAEGVNGWHTEHHPTLGLHFCHLLSNDVTQNWHPILSHMMILMSNWYKSWKFMMMVIFWTS